MATTSKGTGVVRVGTRDSELALVQTHHVVDLLRARHPDLTFEIITMKTIGDKILDVALPKIGDKGLFTKELEAALAVEAVDLVVHSLKDVPSVLPDGMTLAGILERADPLDVVVLKAPLGNAAASASDGGGTPSAPITSLAQLPPGAIVGTSSVRRAAQILRKYPQLRIESVRGNLNTRLRKLDQLDGEIDYACLVLAAAGMERLGWKSRVSFPLLPPDMYYAVGQGALGIECRTSDAATTALIRSIAHRRTTLTMAAERTLMNALNGGCSVPLGVHSVWSQGDGDEVGGTGDGRLCLDAAVISPDGTQKVSAAQTAPITCEEDAVTLGRAVANLLLTKGARPILDLARA